jgi:hypothetical protein
MMTAFSATIGATATQKNLSTVSALIVNASETAFSQIQTPVNGAPNPYVQCATPSSYSSEISSVVSSEPFATNYQVQVLAVWYWAAGTTTSGSTVSSTSFQATNTCILGTASATAPQEVWIQVTAPRGGTYTGSFVVDDDAPPGITSVALGGSGTTAGELQAGDTISVVFNTAMNATDFCSNWASNPSSPVSLPVSADMAVSPGSAASPPVIDNTIYIGGTPCGSGSTASAFNFGYLDLGSAAFAAYSSTGADTVFASSTATWYSAPSGSVTTPDTLVITLGGTPSGTSPIAGPASGSGAINSPSYVYNSSPLIESLANQAISNAQYILPQGAEFP